MSAAASDGEGRAALVGAGMISLYHLRAWQAVQGARVVAICDVDERKARERAAEFGVERVYSDPGRMFAEGGFELADIAASVDAHAPLTRLAADYGVHVLLQKPMTRTVAQAEALVADIGDRVRFMMHENYRFRPHYMTVRRWIEEGRIGVPRHAAIVVRGSGLCSLDGETPFLVKRQPYLLGFDRNLVFETMIHHLDVLRLLVGPLRVGWGLAEPARLGLPGEDTASILMEGLNGLIATADGCILRAGLPAAPRRPPGRSSGTRATIVMDYDRVFLDGAGGRGRDRRPSGPLPECFDRTIRLFVEGVRDRAPFETDRLDNLETMRLMESVTRPPASRVHP
jgi:predicted dehydrogenase